jgi:two-component system sensor histidine kinase PhoQ
MENAYKYGSTKVQIDSHSSNEQLQIAIADNGQGIAPEQRQTILQRGQRADTATPGQGIGLAVAVDIISSYNGELSVDKAALGGALFTINLPLPS